MRAALGFAWFFLAFAASAQTAILVPLPVAQANGITYDSRDNQTLSGVVVGVLIPPTGPITSIAPLIAEVSYDGTLGKPVAGPWAGTPVTSPLRIEKAGSAVAGLRTLVTVSGRTVRTRQFQVLWKTWTAGQLSGPEIDSRVYGEAAGARDLTKVVELRLTSPLGALGLYGQVDEKILAEFSLIQRPPVPETVIPPVQAGPSGPTAPSVLLSPKAPVVDPVTLKR